MKNIITAAALALGLTVAAVPAKAMDVEFCTPLSELASNMASLRDQGYGPQEIYDILLQNNIKEELAVILLTLVYVDVSHASPEDIKAAVFTTCLSEAI